MGTIDELFANNEPYAESYDGAGLSPKPVRKVAVVACMDARLDVHGALGLHPGDAHVIRNAGGIVTDDVIRSLLISQRVLGTRSVILIHHTDCGLAGTTDEALGEIIDREIGTRPTFPLGAFPDTAGSVLRSIEKLKASGFVFDQEIRGYIFDTETGRLNEVR